MPKQIIHIRSLSTVRPIIWHGRAVYRYGEALRNILAGQLGSDYANLLSEVHVEDQSGKGYWLSSAVSKNARPLTSLISNEQEAIKARFASMLEKIQTLALQLQNSDKEDLVQIGEFLQKAFEIPDPDCIRIHRNRIVLVCWAFSSDESESADFRIVKYLPGFKMRTKEEVGKLSSGIEAAVIAQMKGENIEKKPPEDTEQEQVEEPPEEDAPKEENNAKIVEVYKRKSKSRFNWWWLLYALLIALFIFLLWLLFSKLNEKPLQLPEYSGKIPPVDSGKVIPDPDDPYKRIIVSDRINIVVKKDINVVDFANSFLEENKKKGIRVIYYDTLLKHIQLQVEDKNLNETINQLKNTYSEIKLAWKESIFSNDYNDPDFSAGEKNWYFKSVGVFKAWEQTKGSEAVKIAVIDDGFDLAHPDIAGNVIYPYHVIQKLPYVNTAGGRLKHGTHVASTIAGVLNNHIGVSGVAPGCKIIPVQVANDQGVITSTAVINGFLYAIVKNADVINISLGMKFPEQSQNFPEEDQEQLIKKLYLDEELFWKDLFAYVRENDISIIAAAGNDNILAGIDPMHRSEDILIVSATDKQMKKASFSNYGEYTTVSAPGVNIYNALPGGLFGFMNGTSMAAPIVSGCVALIKSVNPNLSTHEIYQILLQTSQTSNEKEKDVGPVIQVDKAVWEAKSRIPN